MEAMWTRFFPATYKIQELIKEGKIGKIVQVRADFGENINIDNLPINSRALDPAQGGGALLDLGVYCITWAFITLYALNGHELPQISSSMFLTTVTKVDRLTVALLTFKRAEAVAFISTNFDQDGGRNVEILGTKGIIHLHTPLYRPTVFNLKVTGEEPQVIDLSIVGEGFYFQADEAAKCIRDGKQECPLMTWSESLDVMQVMDEIRKQGGLVYPTEKK